MARATITPTAVPFVVAAGLNLTDATFDTLSTGSGNGVQFPYDPTDLVVLKNTTGGNAVFTLVLAAQAAITAVGGTVGNPTVTVATGKTRVMRLPGLFRQSDGNVYIDCDVAAQILVLNL